jgi:carboxyl-terminal processing protease
VSETSATELKQEITSLKGKGMKSLVLDLRLNPGGLLDQGVEVADLFLDTKQEIVSTRGRARGSSRQFVDEARQVWPNLPIVVLVNEGSASAAEIIAGAMQDHDRAVVVGTPTFGKGLVQTLFTLGENVALKLTTARWYTPSGRTIQRVARNEEEQFDIASRDTGAVDAQPGTRTDSTAADSVAPIFHTDAGRLVRGGGGIVPDIVMRQDSTSPGERAFIEAVGSKVQEYRDVLTTYALDLKRDRGVTSEDFRVTPAMRSEVVARLGRKGIVLTPDVITQSGRLLDQNLSYEIARYVFGRPAEFRRRAQDDRQMQTAMDLLRKASTPAALLGLANTPGGSAAPSRN